MKRTKNYMEVINSFSKKNLIWGKWAILDEKMGLPGSTLRIFLKFCIVKGAKRYMKIILLVVLKYFEQMRHFGPKNGVI